MIDLENKEERNKLIDDFFNKGLDCNIKEVYQAVVNTVADLEYEDVKKTKEIERLHSIIKEAIEFCNKWLDCETDEKYEDVILAICKIREILKGSDKE